MYVFDTDSLSKLFKYFYPQIFQSLWKNIDELVEREKLASVKEVYEELKNWHNKPNMQWCENNKCIFHPPTKDEGLFLQKDLFEAKNGHFRQLLKPKHIADGKPCADPFLIAKAKCTSSTIVTEEHYDGDGGIRIPTVCKYFKINCLNLENFMEEQKWKF